MCRSVEPIKLLVLSDIHFGKYAISEEFGSTDAANGRRMIPSLVEKLEKLNLKADAMLVAGDLTSVASPKEFKGCITTVEKIAQQVGVPLENVFHTYGNHDVDWRVCNLGKAADGILEDKLYHEIAAKQGSLICRQAESLEAGPVPGSGVYQDTKYTLFVLNSGYFCTADQSHRHGKIGQDQLEWIEGRLKGSPLDERWRIAMIHHHPFNYTFPAPVPDTSCVEEGAELVALFGKYGVDLVVHGHRHHPRVFTSMNEDWTRPVTFCCAGSFAVNAHHRDSGRIPNLFHFVTMEKRLENGGAFGTVQTFEFSSGDGWRAVRETSETPLDHQKWFGSTATSLEQEDEAKAFLRNAADLLSAENKFVEIKQVMLPPTIQCCSESRLNELLRQQAGAVGCKIVGRYPDEIAITRQ